MISMAVLTPFFDVVAGVAILAGRSSLLDKGVFKTANTNFTVRHLLALGFIGYGGWNLWKIERAQDKLKKTLDAESFSADSFENLPHAYPELREYVLTNEESMEFWELIEARMRAAKEEGLEDWENDSNAHLLSGHIQELIWEHDDFDAESFSAESGDKPSCGHADCMDFGMDGWLSDRAIVFRYYTQWFNGVGQDEFFAYTGAWKPILALNALSPEDMKDIANTERDVVGCYRGGFNAESFGAENKNEMELILADGGWEGSMVLSGDEDAIKYIIKQSAFIEEYRPDIGMPEDLDDAEEWLDQWFEDNDLETIAQETGWTITKVSSNAVFWGNRKGIIVADETWWTWGEENLGLAQ